jgi:short-subunit dehydrogenase
MSERPVALITGASMGIGEAFVDALAARGYDLVLVARSGAALEQIGARVSAAHGVRAISIAADLEDPAAVEHVATQTLGQFGRVDVLINNAGYGAHGRFETIDPARHSGQIALNIAALVDLTNRLAPGMLARGSGGIINVASIAGFQPVPYMAVYGATKAFVLSFSEALSEEFRGRGVRVLALCPGATRTNFFKRAGEGAQATPFRTSEAVVRTALRAYDRGASCVVDGRLNWLSSVSSRFVPRSAVLRIAARLMKPTTP